MKLEEIINGLIDLQADRESFITKDEPDSIFSYDKKVLGEAIRLLKGLQKYIAELQEGK